MRPDPSPHQPCTSHRDGSPRQRCRGPCRARSRELRQSGCPAPHRQRPHLSTSRPAASSDNPSSLPEQSIPSEVTPRILRRPISIPPGSTVPTGASGTRSPSLKFQAPQTISSSPPPASTRTLRIRSAPSIADISLTRATTTPSMPSPNLLNALDHETELVCHRDERLCGTEGRKISQPRNRDSHDRSFRPATGRERRSRA